MVHQSQTLKITGGEAIIRSLIDGGVNVLFGYPGGAVLPTYDALYRFSNKIRHILVRHEQGAIHAAEGYARISRKVGVCIATSGPGATNLITGICDAMMDSIPIVCITGQVVNSVVGTDAFQEADIMGITAPITKWNYQITKAEEIPEVIAKSLYIAQSGRPGPVVIDVTKTAQSETLNYVPLAKKIFIDSYQPNLKPNLRQIKLAAELLNKAKRPYVLAGHGVLISRAEKELLALVEKGGYPVAVTLLGLSAIRVDHPLYVGFLGMHGNYGPNFLTNKADVILAVGLRFDDRVTGRVSDYAKSAKIIHIDIDPAELNKIIKVEIPIVADAKEALKELVKHIKKGRHQAWLREFRKCDRIEKEKVVKKLFSSGNEKIRMGYVIDLLSKKTKGKAIIVTDVGQNQMFTARYYQFKSPNSIVTSGGLGTMGFGLPAAIGAKIAAPERPVFAVLGDGGFQMTIQELATITQERLPIKIIVLNNSYLGMVRQWQELFYEKRYSQVFLKNPDFIQVAKGYFIDGERVRKKGELAGAFDRLVKSKNAYLLEVEVEEEDNVFPMIPSGASVEEIRLE
ncbi:MAG: biosynthetic-type acetolactate synthase large subunit [Patescibacteria group bacterium]|nr:biosynthetic-type acetolactate synthase large subunit [Patescibacteria group bacterium]